MGGHRSCPVEVPAPAGHFLENAVGRKGSMFKFIGIATLLGGVCTMVVMPTPDRSSPSPPPQFKIDRLEILADTTTRNYISPRLNGEPVAFCRIGRSQCGKEAADAFCRSFGFEEARTFRRDSMQLDPTKLYFQQIKCWYPEVAADALTNALISPRLAPGPIFKPSG
jgi:hypothetical protein